MPVRFPDDPTGWFVRRAGLARVTTFACALGLSLAAIVGSRPWTAAAGLTWALLSALGGILLSHRRAANTGRPSVLVVVAVVSIGLFAGYFLGSVRVAALTGSQLKESVGSVVRGELTVTGQVRSGTGWQSAIAVLREIQPEPSGLGVGAIPGRSVDGEKVLLELAPADGGTAVSLSQGHILAFTGKIRPPDGPSASGFDEAAYLRNQGVEVVLQADSGGITVLGRRGGVSGWFDRLRYSALAHLSRGPDPRLDEVLQGVVVGETGGIDRSWSEAFRRSGTAHMFSVSGLHVASLAAIMIGLAGLLRAPRGVGFLLAALTAVLLIPFVGASPPVVRAAVMIVIVLAGRWLGRGRDQWQVLALAASVVLALNPFALGDVGFQLSFTAFAGMLALTGPLRRMLGRLPDSLSSGLAVSIAATVGTAPVSLLVFDRTSLVSPVANLLVVPMLPAITGLGMASVFLGFLWTGFSTALDLMASIPVVWTVLVSRLFAVAPVLGVQDLGRVLTAIACGAAAMPVVLTLCRRTVAVPFGVSPPFLARSLRWVRTRAPRDRRLAAALGIFLLMAATLTGGALYPSLSRGVEAAKVIVAGSTWPEGTEVRILDISQGNAVLVRTPEHHALLFDGGPAGCGLASQLHGLGVSTVDLAVISHPHADHFAGLLEAAGELEVGAFIDQTMVVASPGPAAGSTAPAANYGSGEAADYLELRTCLAEKGCRYARGVTGSEVEVDGVVVRFFAPVSPLSMTDGLEPWPSGPPTGDELNGSSLVAVVSIGSIDILIPGDAEADVLEAYELPPVEIILVPHHGSLGAVSLSLLDRLEPVVACISVGEDNSFGHPDASCVALLRERVGRVLRTDESGWVSFTVAGDHVVLTTERSPGSERGQQGG
jgi:competence protein ComEC